MRVMGQRTSGSLVPGASISPIHGVFILPAIFLVALSERFDRAAALRYPGGPYEGVLTVEAWVTIFRAQGKKADMTGDTPAGAKRRILVIEDEMLISMLLEDMLADLGHEVAGVVPRLNEAMTAAQGDGFDLAILDVHLHGQAAYPVADVLIERGRPFVFATGYGERGLPEKYRKHPILTKPFAREDLERVINTLKA